MSVLMTLAVSVLANLWLSVSTALPAPIVVQRWSTSGPLDGPVVSLAHDPQQPGVVYAGTLGDERLPSPEGSLWRSSDYGASWVKLGSAEDQVTAIGIDPLVGGRLFASVRRDFFVAHSSAVFRSNDDGRTWLALNGGVPGFVAAFAFDPIQPGTVYVAGFEGVAKTTDGGATWVLVYSSNPGPQAIAIDPSSPLRIYAGGAGVVRSTDGGKTWQSLPIGPVYVRSLTISPSAPSIIYAGTDQGAFRSPDGGDTWLMSSTGLPAGSVSSVVVDPNDAETVYSTTREGVFESHDGGQNWSPLTLGLEDVRFGPLAIAPSGRTLYVGTDSGVFLIRSRKPAVVPFR